MTEPRKFGSDLCAGFFEYAWEAGVVPFVDGAKVLEIGSAEYDWLEHISALRPDLQLSGIDWRGDQFPGVVKGDVLTHDFPLESFDAVVAISTLEHIGLGSYKEDPLDRDGDTKAMRRAWSWLKPGGWLYFDVPYRAPGKYHVTSNYRGYDPEHFQSRLCVVPYKEIWRKEFHEVGGDGPYIACVWQK